MAPVRALVLFLACSSSLGWVLKVGGPVQPTGSGAKGKAAFDLWKQWAANTSAGYTVEFHWTDYSSATAAEVAKNLTDPTICNPVCVDVLVCPYGSGGSITTIGGVPANSKVPILVWGGASDSIFSTSCPGLKCFGTFTVGSKYLVQGLAGLTSFGPKTVGLIQNDNAFSSSVADGARTEISSNMHLTKVADVTVAKGVLSASDMTLVDSVIAAEPDIIAIAGHSGGDVEDIIMRVANASTFRTDAILATNSITTGAEPRFSEYGMSQYMEGLLMPTQWARKPGMADTVVGWTSDDFTALIGSDMATYHAASAGAAGVAVANALHGKSDASSLAADLATLSIDTFYGPISFNVNGSIADKPMYVQQKHSMSSPVTMPVSAASGYLRFPLSATSVWKSSQRYTCGDVKMAYKNAGCCGMPSSLMALR